MEHLSMIGESYGLAKAKVSRGVTAVIRVVNNLQTFQVIGGIDGTYNYYHLMQMNICILTEKCFLLVVCNEDGQKTNYNTRYPCSTHEAFNRALRIRLKAGEFEKIM